MDNWRYSKDMRDLAIRLLRKKMPNLAKLVSRKEYFISAKGFSEEIKIPARKLAGLEDTYLIVDFTSKQIEHVNNPIEYSQMIYRRLMGAGNYFLN